MIVPGRTRREVGRFLKFAVVGTIGAVVDFGSFNLLHIRFGLPGVPASGVSFLLAVTSNFVWNRFWTYPDSRSKPVSRQAGQFTAISLVGLAIRVPLFAATEMPMIRVADTAIARWPWLAAGAAISPELLGRNLALALAVLVVLFWNFAANRMWTYSDAA